MGLFEKVLNALGGDGREETKSNSEPAHGENSIESSMLLDPELLEDTVNSECRTTIIAEHYDDVDDDQAAAITAVLKEYIETYNLQKHEAKKEIRERTELGYDRVEEIFWTERASIQICDSVRSYADSDTVPTVTWLGGREPPCSPICEEVYEITEEEPLSLDELQSLLREKAREYEDGTPERMDHWSPHPKCAAALQPVIG
ncbi:hypothetical protein [Halorubrum sp. SD683]|uniref:hypothetical protein n=1 Tax=Halorubrum sp. SD683 TaxID=1855873 RepID=UPI000A2E75D0|nr:hypothetical protein [Halorubrum sp. SD683]OTF01857.1 hypothetical protein B9G49_01005 [Halorubrum sp. SD683]